MCGAGKAERAERSGLSRFFFGYFLCSNDKESNSNKTYYKMHIWAPDWSHTPVNNFKKLT